MKGKKSSEVHYDEYELARNKISDTCGSYKRGVLIRKTNVVCPRS